MAQSEFKSLSQEELRKRLYQTFKKKGVLDLLKTQLRNQLIQDLKLLTSSAENRDSPDLSSYSLIHRACNSLVLDHLRRCGYEYSLSVFYPECGLDKEKVFTVHDLMQLMKINPKSRLYKSLQTSFLENRSSKGVLLEIMTELIDYHLCKDGRDADTQTFPTSPYKESIVEKLKFIDDQFEELYPKRSKFESLEGKLAEYRREMDEQLHLEMSQKIQHFKDVEIAKIKMEESEKSHKEISAVRRELEKSYQLKMEGLVSREKNAIERLQRQQEIEAKEIYAQRQILLKEIEAVRNKEIELRQRIEAFELAQRLQEEKNKSVDDLLRKRELEVKNIGDTFDQKLKNELLRYQIELKEEYMRKIQKVSEDDRKNREDAARLREDTLVINMRKLELEQAITRSKDLEIEVDTLKAQLSMVSRQNHHMTDKLKELVDFPFVQEERVELQAHVKLLKQQLEELQKENILLKERISQPSAELLSLQEELKQMESARKFDQDEFKIQKEILEKQLELETERGLEMKMQLLNREECSKRLADQVERLEFRLQQTQQALDKEAYCIPKAALVHRHIFGFPANKSMPLDSFVDKPVLKSQHLLDTIETGGFTDHKLHHLEGTRSSSPDSDMEFVASTKARIKELEKEAEFLEEAYRNYHYRVHHTPPIKVYQNATSPPRKGYLSSVRAGSHPKVTFLEDNLTQHQHILLNNIKTQKYKGLLLAEENIVLSQKKKSSTRRLSSTPVSKVEKSLVDESIQDKDGSYILSPQHSPNHRFSPIPKVEQITTLSTDSPGPELKAEIEPLPSACLPSVISLDLTDHSKPEKLHVEDLHQSDSSLRDQEDIPEQLESDLSHPSGDFVHDIRVTADVPVAATSLTDPLNSQDKTENSSRKSKESDPEYRPEEPHQDLSEILEKSHNHQETKTSQAEEDPQVNDPEVANPLDKYMQLILQRTEEQSEKFQSTKESLENISVVDKLSNESITAQSVGEGDDDFW